MSDAFKLFDAICEGWTKCLPQPYGDGQYSSEKDGLTDCNRFVNFVCARMGYEKFLPAGQALPMLANAMVDHMAAHPDEWQELNSGQTAQYYANQGLVVVAGWTNPEGGHGHVCIVRPGVMGSSGKWQSTQVPKVANVSRPEFCRIDRGANFAFDQQPRYFVLTNKGSH